MTTETHLSALARGELAEAEQSLLARLCQEPAAYDLHLDAVRIYHELNEPERAAIHLGRARELLAGRPAGSSAATARLQLAEALDHLAHRDAARASHLLARLLRDGAFAADAPHLLEALLLAAEADLAAGNAFRSLKHAEKASALPGADQHPEMLARALLVQAHYHVAKGSHERAQALALQARGVAERGARPEPLAEAESFLADHGRRSTAGPGRSVEPAEAGIERQAAAAILRRLAEPLPPERRRSFLAHPRRARILAGPQAPAGATGAPRPEAALGGEPAPGRRLVATLSEITALINSMTDLAALLERVMDVALAIVGAERGLVILFDRSERATGTAVTGGAPRAEGAPRADGTLKLEVKVARNLDGGAVEGLQEFSRNVVREVARGREVVAFDTAADSWMSQQQSVMLYSIRSLVCFPLRIKDDVIGAVYLDNQKSVKAYRDDDLDFLRAFTNLAAIAIENSRLLGRLSEENLYLKKVAGERFRSTNIIGTGPAMARVFRLVDKAMDTAFPVLITGETGTGKEVITKAIHFGSLRKERPFVAQNCAAIPSELLESEMFGYKRGAFTGADQDKKGLFEIASGGTLFLDEIGELDIQLQAKLLRVLQDGSIRRVGETTERKVDVRIIAATNRNLKEAVDRGSFRLDLYYRLNVLQIELPALRERPEDIPLLAHTFLDRCNRQMGREIRGFTTRAVERLVAYPWPGNVRELENAVARGVVFAERDVIDIDSLPSLLADGDSPVPAAFPAPTAAGAAPIDTATIARARRIFEQMTGSGTTFWEAVKKPFLKRDLSREVAREVVRIGLEACGWKYTRALKAFNLTEEDYRRFMNFLAKFDLKVERPMEPF